MKKAIIILMMLFSLCQITSVGAADTAQIKLPDLIGDHVLIQQGKPIKLWGSAGATETVKIQLKDGNTVKASASVKTDADGKISSSIACNHGRRTLSIGVHNQGVFRYCG